MLVILVHLNTEDIAHGQLYSMVLPTQISGGKIIEKRKNKNWKKNLNATKHSENKTHVLGSSIPVLGVRPKQG